MKNVGNIVNEILKLADEITALERENDKLKSQLKVDPGYVQQTVQETIEAELIELAKEQLFKDTFMSWSARVSFDEEEQVIRPTYNDWFVNVINDSRVPNWISRKDFMELMGPKFRAEYESRLALAKSGSDE